MGTQSESSLETIAIGKAWDIFSKATIEVPPFLRSLLITKEKAMCQKSLHRSHRAIT